MTLHGDVSRVGVRPFLERGETLFEGEAVRFEVDVLHVQHLESRLIQLWETRVRIRPVDQDQCAPHRIEPAFGIGEDVQLDLPHASAELFFERQGRVLQTPRGFRGIESGEQFQYLVARLNVVAVVCSKDLNLVDAKDLVLFGPRIGVARASEERQRRGAQETRAV